MKVEELKRDFEIFGKGVERLEQLKAEFDEIDATGHEEEAEEIRGMLKNVSAIPVLEVKIAKLKKAVYEKKHLTHEYRRFGVKISEEPIEISRVEEELRNKFQAEFYKQKSLFLERYDLEFKNKVKELELKNIEILQNKEHHLRAKLQHEFEAKEKSMRLELLNELEKQKRQFSDKELTAELQRKNLEYLKIREGVIRREVLAEIDREKENLRKQYELEITDYRKKYEHELKELIKNKLEHEFHQKLLISEKQIRSGIEAEFNKKLSEKESHLKQQIEKEKYLLKERESAIKHEALADLERAKELLRKKHELEIKDLNQKLQYKEIQVKKDLEEEFKNELGKLKDQLKEKLQREIEAEKHKVRQEIKESVNHILYAR